MNTKEDVDGGLTAIGHPRAECRPMCGCGQDLDSPHRTHCPRCGSDVAHLPLHPEHVGAGPLGWVA